MTRIAVIKCISPKALTLLFLTFQGCQCASESPTSALVTKPVAQGMGKNAAAQHYLSKALCFLVLLTCLWLIRPVDAAFLSYILTFVSSGSGSWRINVQGQLNTETFIDCDSNINCHTIGFLRNKLNGTKILQLQVNVLKDAADLFKAEVVTMREPLTLQAIMHCGHDVNGDFHGSWDFHLNGRKMLHFDSRTRKLTEVDSESSQMKSILKKIEDITNFLSRTSQGDCRSWLEEFKLYEGEKLEPTGLVKESTYISTSSSPTTKPDGVQSSATARNPSAFVLLLTIALLVLLQYLQ